MKFTHPSSLVSFQDLEFLGIDSNQCSYLPHKQHHLYFFARKKLNPKRYQELLDLGFRRSGNVLYRPQCLHCTECEIIRIPINEFQMTRSQKRIWRKLKSVTSFRMVNPHFTYEKLSIYLRYLFHFHKSSFIHDYLFIFQSIQEVIQNNIFLYPDQPSNSQEINEEWVNYITKHFNTIKEETVRKFGINSIIYDYERFFVESCLDHNATKELNIYYNNQLIGVGILDFMDTALSSVYFYFDPDYKKFSLGTFSILVEIQIAKKMNYPYYYLGYYIQDNPKMNYKAKFKPYELKKIGEKKFRKIIK